ncbi:NAD-binding protein [Mycobacterium vicinigordonae]|uniref:NAD-binding protein n=1 Tax=Mycobacterium vicinigordonae TaxID=1719132 RepID=A0A7D6IAI7_9MYCO|nr:NAD-binding protein [Mycobacterium vicinigordonae]QLL08797.1 NAD-binding protein [Mycobacterium vicinigordonae]
MSTDHIIVSGDDALAMTIVDELRTAGATVIRLEDTKRAGTKNDLYRAGIAHARAVVCAGSDDSVNLEVALLADRANPGVRVVARLSNDILRKAFADSDVSGAMFDVAELAAPSVVEACLAHSCHPLEVAGIPFVIAGTSSPQDTTLGDLCGELAPVAVIRGEKSASPGELEACPPRDLPVSTGDWTVMIGTAEEVAAQGVEIPLAAQARSHRTELRGIFDGLRAFRNDVNPAFYPLVGIVVALVIISTVLLRFGHQNPRMSWVDALYFTAETISTTGYGDFSLMHQPTWLRLFAATMMFVGLTTIALLVAFVADVLLSSRFVQNAAGWRIARLRDHIVVIGLSALGIRVVSDLVAAGHEVAVVEIDEDNPFLTAARELHVPVIVGDAMLSQTLKSARVDRARAVAVLTHEDMVNIGTGITLAQLHGRPVAPLHSWPDIPVVLRVFDRPLGFALAQQFGFVNARSTVELVAPWFIAAAINLQVLDTFSVGLRSFVVGAIRVAPDSELDGVKLSELPTQTQVIAINRGEIVFPVHSRSETALRAGDTAYLVGPYRDLLDTLSRGKPARSDSE